uniref:Thioredoxin domain-containing protein n=1 Tax=Accipiter nisus TaxID=211598 RepID=A0A8B9NQ94_9AVES
KTSRTRHITLLKLSIATEPQTLSPHPSPAAGTSLLASGDPESQRLLGRACRQFWSRRAPREGSSPAVPPPSSRPQVRLRRPTYLAPPPPALSATARCGRSRPAARRRPAPRLALTAARASGRARPGPPGRPPSLLSSFAAAGGPGPRRDLPGRRSNPPLGNRRRRGRREAARRPGRRGTTAPDAGPRRSPPLPAAASAGRHGLGGEAGPRVPRVRADGAALPRPAHLRALLRRQGRRGQELVPGLRDGWKDPNNEFRKNLKLTGVPTLLKYGTPQKLVEEECFKAELVRMLFTED